jgi:hypothetical protein
MVGNLEYTLIEERSFVVSSNKSPSYSIQDERKSLNIKCGPQRRHELYIVILIAFNFIGYNDPDAMNFPF